MFVEDLLLSHPVGKPAEDVINRDPHAADARLTVPLVRFES
jgi:hypothetical protein